MNDDEKFSEGAVTTCTNCSQSMGFTDAVWVKDEPYHHGCEPPGLRREVAQKKMEWTGLGCDVCGFGPSRMAMSSIHTSLAQNAVKWRFASVQIGAPENPFLLAGVRTLFNLLA